MLNMTEAGPLGDRFLHWFGIAWQLVQTQTVGIFCQTVDLDVCLMQLLLASSCCSFRDLCSGNTYTCIYLVDSFHGPRS